MNPADIDLDYLLGREFSRRDGVYRLWLQVFLSAFFALKNGNDYAKGARGFLFDEENQFFQLVADELGYEPSGLRERIRKALIRDQSRR